MDGKKKIKNINKRLLIIFLIISAIVSASLGIKAYARATSVPIETVSQSSGTDDTAWFTLYDLDTFWYILCCQHGKGIAHDDNSILEGSYSGTSFSVDYSTPETLPEEGDKLYEHTNTTEGNDFDHTSYQVETYGVYNVTHHNYVTNPAESYIIAEANPTNAGNHSSSAVQQAWWNTYMGHVVTGGSAGSNNALNQEATAFQSYICKLLGISDPGEASAFDTSTYYTTQNYYIEETGESGTVTAPNISYSATINSYKDGDTEGVDVDKNGTINDADKVSVSYEEDTQSYLIGPFSIDYVEAGLSSADFATITSAVLKTNIGDSVLLGSGESDRSNDSSSITYGLDINNDINWKFRFVANTSTRTSSDTYEFPHSGEVFYIEIEYIAGMTEIEGLNFEFKYLNAGGLIDLYQGDYYTLTWTAKDKTNTVYYDVYDKTTNTRVAHNITNTSAYSSSNYTIQVSYTTYDHWLECSSVTSTTSQALGYVLKGVRWYQYTNVGVDGGVSLNWSTITIDKITVNEYGNKVNVDDTFSFTIYIDRSGGTNYTEFETVTVTTKDGEGTATTAAIFWDEGVAPSYKIVEGEKEGYTSDGPWTGTLSQYANKVLTIKATNYVEPYSGTIEVDKRLVNSSEALESETFTFEVVVTGTFSYDGGEVKTYTDEEPLKLTITIQGAGEWTSKEFEWWDESNAPKYTITEVIPEDADYECVSTNPKTGTVYDRDEPTVEIFYNQSIDGTYLHVDKKIVNETAPEDDESFRVIVTITGTFEYDGVQYTNETLTVNDIEDIILNKSNNWTWNSKYITWKTTKAPTFTVQEDLDYMADYYKFNSIQGSRSNDYSSRLSSGDTYVTVRNEKILLSGNIVINKIATTEDISGQSFDFTVQVTGTFSYNGGERQTYTDENPLTLTASVVADGDSWTSNTFTWYDTDESPKYTVTEGDLPDGVTFVSISNGTDTVTSSQSISGTLEGGENTTETVTVICKNKGIPTPEEGKIRIKKLVEGNTSTTDVFTFNLTISGTFSYVDESGNILKTVDNGTLTFSNESGSDYSAITITGVGEWTSETIKWNSQDGAPTYVVEEIDIPEDATFDHWDVKTGTVQTKTTGTITMVEGENVATAVNKVEEPVEGYITLKKITGTDPLGIVSGDIFTFKIKVTGTKFSYDGTEYNTSSPLELTVTVKADGDTWKSEKFTWYESDGAPKYEVQEQLTETQSNNGVKLEYIKNESGSSTSSTTWLAGTIPSGGSSSDIICSNGTDNITYSGKVKVYKYLYDSAGNEVDGVTFTFDLVITYADGTTSTIPFEVTSGSSWTSDTFYWGSGETAPTYEVKETTKSVYTVEKTNATGSLVKDETVKVYFRNYTKEKDKWGKISITKSVINEDKVSVNDQVSATFTFNITVTGDFTYVDAEGNISYYTSDGNAFTYTAKVTTDEPWESGTFYWYDEAPTYSIEETNLPTGYSLESISPSYGSLSEGRVTSVECINKVGSDPKYVLTMELGGKVWDDTDDSDGKIADVGENGVIDEGEAGIEGVKVTVYRVFVNSSGKIIGRSSDVYAYDENDNLTRVENYTYTDSNGNWSFGSISVPAFVSDSEESQYSGCSVSYDVEFSYDGQTYEPTTYLQNSENYGIDEYDITGKSAQFVNSSTATRDEWLYDSAVIDDETERENFNSKFTNIEGGSAIDTNGNTVGKATGSGSDITLNYTSTDSVSILNSDNTRKVSTLETYDDSGEIYSDFIMESRTSTGALTYPFDDNIQLTSWDKEITWYGTQVTYRYSATYNYCLSINLGLIRREAADTATEKDLTEATVVVNGKVIKYKFNSAIDLESDDWSDLLFKQIAVADEEIEYSLNIYSSDYYYRASIYDGTDVGNALSTFYSSIGLSTKSTELEIYLKYTINVYNESETYDVVVNEVADYYDDTFELITDSDSQSNTYVQTLNGEDVNSTMNLADESSITFYDSNGNVVKTLSSVSWNQTESGITGSDGVSYNKIVTSEIGNTSIEAGGKAEIQLTFKVTKDTTDADDVEYGAVEDITDSITLGAKHNVAEVTSFSSYNSTKSKNKWSSAGDLAGRVDEDSAPDNINIKELNDKTWYEDDTDSAPVITISLYDEDREVNGLVWEDSQTSTIEYSQTVGDGVYNIEDGDTVISGLTTEMVEVVSVPTGDTDADGNAVYEEYEFIWPTSESLSFLGNHTLEELTGFDSTTTTNASGEYEFTGIAAGNYKVRFVYGDTKILTGNDDYEVVYNGQDYKSTSYQVGFDNDSDDDGYVDNDWQDLSNSDLASSRVSDARDSEARRVYISSKSEILTYTNTSLLATADENSSDTDYYSELFGDYEAAKDDDIVTGSGYYMYAETAKLDLEIENIYNIDNSTTEDSGISVVAGQSTKGNIANVTYTYTINNIDFGIEERSQTKLTLDKQIKEILVKTADGSTLLDAVYNITYELGDDDTIKSIVELDTSASVGTNNLQSLNRTSSNQGYRYVMIDSTILQGATLTATYQLTVFNVGEADTSNYSLTELWSELNSEGYEYDANNSDDALNKVLSELTSPYHTVDTRLISDYSSTYEYGSYLGNIYYLGTDGTYFTEDSTDAYGDYIVLAKTIVHGIIDYVDPDVEFVASDNLSVDQSWSTTSIDYLVQNGLIDPSAIIIVDSEGNPVTDTNDDGTITVRTYADYSADTTSGQSYAIMNNELQQYIITNDDGSEVKNNVVINIDSGSDSGDNGTNPDLVKETVPYSANENYDEATASITLQVSKYYSSESDGDDIDNIAEIIKVENTVGRRDVRTIAGNTITYQLEEGATGYDETVDIYTIAGEEPDVSATEVITLSPPTGAEISAILIVQILSVILVAAVIILVGIIIIKKKVLVK